MAKYYPFYSRYSDSSSTSSDSLSSYSSTSASSSSSSEYKEDKARQIRRKMEIRKRLCVRSKFITLREGRFAKMNLNKNVLITNTNGLYNFAKMNFPLKEEIWLKENLTPIKEEPKHRSYEDTEIIQMGADELIPKCKQHLKKAKISIHTDRSPDKAPAKKIKISESNNKNVSEDCIDLNNFVDSLLSEHGGSSVGHIIIKQEALIEIKDEPTYFVIKEEPAILMKDESTNSAVKGERILSLDMGLKEDILNEEEMEEQLDDDAERKLCSILLDHTLSILNIFKNDYDMSIPYKEFLELTKFFCINDIIYDEYPSCFIWKRNLQLFAVTMINRKFGYSQWKPSPASKDPLGDSVRLLRSLYFRVPEIF